MGLAPERFSDKRAGRSEQAAHFDRRLGLVKFSNNKPDALLVAGTQDRLSVLLQLAGILGGNPERYKIVNRITLPVVGVDGLETWEFRLEGEQDINLPAANMRALKLVRKQRHEYDPKLELWLSAQLGYLPVRIRQSQIQNPENDYFQLSIQRLP